MDVLWQFINLFGLIAMIGLIVFTVKKRRQEK